MTDRAQEDRVHLSKAQELVVRKRVARPQETLSPQVEVDELDVDGRRVTGRGVSVDVVEASARAYLAAINRALRVAGPQEPVDPAAKVMP